MTVEELGSSQIETRLFINGEFRTASGGKSFTLINPFTRQPIADVSEATEADVNDAVAAAKAAFPKWRDLDPRQRGTYLQKLATLIRESNDDLARLEALSTGKPISSYFDGHIAANNASFFSEAGWNVQGTSSLNTPGFMNITLKQPYGVAGCIIPWNVPVYFFVSKAAPALAAGNTVVLKTSEKAPLTSAYVAHLVQKAGFPPGVINVLSGFGSPAGSTIASHMDVRCISFTGSTLTGQKIQAAAASSNMKHVHLELGGKSPAVVFEDADLDSAAAQTQLSISILSGQTCMANSRIYVQESVAKKFLASFKSKLGAAVLGDPLDLNTSNGPQIDKIQYERVKMYLDIGEKDGTRTLGGDARDGYFVKPTMFENVSEESRLMKEEVFGPVVVVNTFKTEAEVIEKANNTEFGLFAAVFTKNIDRAVRLSKSLEAGTVAVNCTSPNIPKDMPFGGYKMSGNGREGFLNSMANYLETKTVMIKIGAE